MTNEKAAKENDFKIFLIIIGFVILLMVLAACSCSTVGYFAMKPILAQKYYSQGVHFKHKGWIFKSKKALKSAISLDKEGSIGKKAAHFLKTKLPKSDNISPLAVQKNIEGFNYDKRKNYKAAIKCFEEAINISPEFEWPYNNLGRIYTNLKKYNKAEKLFKKALSINPDYYNGHINFGYMYWKRGNEFRKTKAYQYAYENYNKALEIYEKAHTINPSDHLLKQDIKKLKGLINNLTKE